jgi:hypothetical protein
MIEVAVTILAICAAAGIIGLVADQLARLVRALTEIRDMIILVRQDLDEVRRNSAPTQFVPDTPSLGRWDDIKQSSRPQDKAANENRGSRKLLDDL